MKQASFVVEWFLGSFPNAFLTWMKPQSTSTSIYSSMLNFFSHVHFEIIKYLPVQRHLKFSHVLGQMSANSSTTTLPTMKIKHQFIMTIPYWVLNHFRHEKTNYDTLLMLYIWSQYTLFPYQAHYWFQCQRSTVGAEPWYPWLPLPIKLLWMRDTDETLRLKNIWINLYQAFPARQTGEQLFRMTANKSHTL